MRGVLVVFAKRPAPGFVKTRLCPPLRPEQAAELYACMLDDVLAQSARAAPALGLEPVLAAHPPAALPELLRRAPAPFRAVPQRGRDHAERMEHAAEWAFAVGAGAVLLRGSDSPALSERALAEACAALARADLVLSPDPDGGYGLVGLARAARGLFAHPMSTGSVLHDTLSNARALGLRTALLAPGFDIDTAADLARLAEARLREPDLPCPRTLAWLDAHASAWRERPAGGTARGGAGNLP